MLLTKLHIPTPSKSLVSRKGLFDRLDEGLNRKLTLVSAPAGYGKTTTIGQWIESKGIPTAWFSVDARDNSPYEFFTLLTRSLQNVAEDVGKKTLELLELPGTVGLEYIIELLINDLLDIDKDILLVFDDFHLINDRQVLESITFLLDFKPEHLHLAILTRADPSLPIARYRSQNELVEIRASDLSFSEKETSELFNTKLNLGVDLEDIRRLDAKIEGWIAGLQLAALTIRGKENKSEYIAKIAGDSRYIMDYLIEEVLDIHDDEMRSFLLFTSILERLCGSLCDSLLQSDNGQLLLEKLEKNNTFIIPLDNQRRWYRYHHLFADLLKKQLIVQHGEKVAELHRGASRWFENSDMPLLAIEHTLAAEDMEGAILQINAIIDDLWETTQVATILKFGRLFSKEAIIANQNFGVIYSWALIVSGELKAGQRYLDQLKKSTVDRKILGRIYETFNFLKVFSGEDEAAFKYSQLAIKNICDEDIVWKTWAYISNGESYLLRFELDLCIKSLQKARSLAKETDNPNLKMFADSKTAYALRVAGRYGDAYEICRTLLEAIRADSSIKALRVDILSSMLYSTIGLIQIERNHIDEGFNNALRGYDLSRNVTSLTFKGCGTLLLAEALYKVGQPDQALKILSQLDHILGKNVAQWLTVLANTLKSKLLIQKGDIENAAILHALSIKQDKNHAFEKYFYNVAKARFLLAQSRYEEAIDLLKKLTSGLERHHAIELLIEVELLKAKAFSAIKEKKKAQASAFRALQYAQSENLVRIFINEGEEIEKLVKEIAKEKLTRSSQALDGISKDYLRRLTLAFDLEAKHVTPYFAEELSSREIEVLGLLANKLSNNEIAETLCISLSTVKTHISHILAKLDAKNRMEAAEIASERGIL